MITKKLGIIGCGNMGGAILYGALESGVIAKENVYVYDINPKMREKAAGWGVTVAANDAEVCDKSELILRTQQKHWLCARNLWTVRLSCLSLQEHLSRSCRV